jgi:hypothetical protein
MATGMDALVLENHVLLKADMPVQSDAAAAEHIAQFQPD